MKTKISIYVLGGDSKKSYIYEKSMKIQHEIDHCLKGKSHITTQHSENFPPAAGLENTRISKGMGN